MPRAKPRRLEETTHIAIVNYLEAVLPTGWLVLHVPNGGKRHVSEARRLKAMGVKAGMPDIQVLGHYGNQSFAGFIEVKAESGVLSKAQKDRVAQLRSLGFPVEVAKSIEDVRRIIKLWLLPHREIFA